MKNNIIFLADHRDNTNTDINSIVAEIQSRLDADVDTDEYFTCGLEQVSFRDRSLDWIESSVIRSAIHELVFEHGVEAYKMYIYIRDHADVQQVCYTQTGSDDIVTMMQIGEYEVYVSDLIDGLTDSQIADIESQIGYSIDDGIITTNTSDCVVIRIDLADMLDHFQHSDLVV